MNEEALILTAEQSAALVAANPPDSYRILQPRDVGDGITFFLNSDVLSDPYFAGPDSPWVDALNELADRKPLAEMAALADANHGGE